MLLAFSTASSNATLPTSLRVADIDSGRMVLHIRAAKGNIVNVSSVAGIRPSPGVGFYGASKAMLTRITQELAVELGPDIRVNAVAPAVVKTTFATALYEGREEQVTEGYPLGRLGAPEDVAAAVAFLASERAGFISGEVLHVTGGRYG